MKGVSTMKVQITLDDALMQRLDAHADENYMSRSGLVSLALTQYLNSADTMKAIGDLAVSMRKIADTGKVDEKTKEELEDFERIAKMLVGR